MKLDTTDLPGATFATITPSLKQVVHNYDWSDEWAVTVMGHGPTTMTVSGTVSGTVARLALIAACEAASLTETNLYFPSINGASDDYYYRVYTSALTLTPITATVYSYEFTATTVVPYIYATSNDEQLT